jgi:flagellar protein FlbD
VINVSKLNGNKFILNALYIETIESFPDTTISLSNGRKYVVKETVDEVQKSIIKFYQSVNLLGQQLEESENEK